MLNRQAFDDLFACLGPGQRHGHLGIEGGWTHRQAEWCAVVERVPPGLAFPVPVRLRESRAGGNGHCRIASCDLILPDY